MGQKQIWQNLLFVLKYAKENVKMTEKFRQICVAYLENLNFIYAPMFT